MLSTEQLLMPRYRVIADYPMSSHAIGDVLTHLIAGTFVNERIRVKEDSLQNYPAIFKPLSWWEERALEDMPLYIVGKNKGDDHYVKTSDWFISDAEYPVTIVNGITYFAPYSKPITEQEYQSFINSNK